MHLRSGKALKTMTKSTSSGVFASSQSSSQAQFTQASSPSVAASVSTTVGAAMVMLVSTETGVTAFTNVLTITAAMTRP